MTSSNAVDFWMDRLDILRSLAPTARGWITLLALAGVTAAAALAPSAGDVALAGSVAVTLAGSLFAIVVACRRQTGHLRSTLAGPEFVPRDDPAWLELTLLGRSPTLGCRISLDRASVWWSRGRRHSPPDRPRARFLRPPPARPLVVGKERVSGSQLPVLAVPTFRRGIQRCHGAALWMYDPLGMFAVRLVTFSELTVVVHPVAVTSQLAEPAAGLGNHDGIGPLAAVSTSGVGGDLLGVRPYRLGDRLSSIHWRSFASTTPLLVRELGGEWAKPMRLIIDDRAGVHRRAAFESALDFVSGAVANRPAGASPVEVRSLSSGQAISLSDGMLPALLRWLAALEPRRTDGQGIGSLQADGTVGPGDTVVTTSTGSESLSVLADLGARLVVVR